MNRYIAVLILVLIFSSPNYGQQSAIYTHELVQFNRALELYRNHQFLAAQHVFESVRDAVEDDHIDSECTYYIANCAVWLHQKGADRLMEDFVAQYPTSIRRNAAYLDVANYYFDTGKYAYARKWYDKVEVANMSPTTKERYNFNNGYAYFKIQRFNEAKKFLSKVEDSENYGAQAKYYLGFIAYEGDNYQQANELFDEVKDLNKYNKNLSYFQSEMNFKSGNFQEAINEGLVQLPKSTPKEKSELNKIIGESYFNLGNYDTAIPYLKAYKGRKGKWNNTDYYLLGYAYYKKGAYQSAISEFNKIIGGRNATAQNAYYHLAESYLKSNQKQEALNAFKNASEMDFDAKIKADAHYNYAKLSYEIGNAYESTPKVVLSYLKAYPNTDNKAEIEALLISSYITSKNYKEAMEVLENNRNAATDAVYQQVALYRGMEVYAEEKYTEAISYFDVALQTKLNTSFAARAVYWKAEANYLLGNYTEALAGFQEFQKQQYASQTKPYSTVDYHIGYTYFKLKKYPKAAQHFKTFATQADAEVSQLMDTYLRLGDSYFISSTYWPAMEAYNKVIENKGADADYAQYQKAISYGFVNKKEQKIKTLTDFLTQYPNSRYRDDAWFVLGDSYIAQQQTKKGLDTYTRLIKEQPRSSYVPKALLKQGLIYYNGDQGEKALTIFKQITAKYPGTEVAIQAVNTARLIYVDMGKTDEYANWVKGLSFISVSDADLDNTVYEAAEKPLIEGNVTASISGFEKYLAQFPSGVHALKSHFHLAQLYFKKGEKEAAIPHYEYVLEKEQTEFTEQSLVRLAQIHLEANRYQKAIPILERLEKEANFPQNIIFAQSNLMKSYYQLVRYEESMAYAELVLQNPKIQNDVQQDAQVFIARSAMQLANETRARAAYTEVQKIATGGLAAEALYYKAYFVNKDGDYKASNTIIQKLGKEFSSHKRFGAMGLVLMAKNFYGLKDAYQATYILESVIQNFTTYPKVIEDATQTLQRIKAEEAKTNSSIPTIEQ